VHLLVREAYRVLPFDVQPAARELRSEHALVNGLEHARAEPPVDADRSFDDCAGDVVDLHVSPEATSCCVLSVMHF
jgi:hypothetical protein